jgi:hypothetical protein
MFVLSRANKICIAGPELTVPFEENLLIQNTKKTDKYQKEFDTIEPGWNLHLLVLEVGSRGYVAKSFSKCLRRLGFSSAETRQLRESCSMMARRCSYIVWIHRSNKNWMPIRFTAPRI